MKIAEFPRQAEDLPPVIPEHLGNLMEVGRDGVPRLRGEMYPKSFMEGNFDREAVVGADVLVYTKEKANRPWVGRVVKVLPDNKFILQWYKRRGVRINTFQAIVNRDGSPVLFTRIQP